MVGAPDGIGWSARTTSLNYDVLNVNKEGVLILKQYGIHLDEALDVRKLY
jgi:hypothetical protein